MPVLISTPRDLFNLRVDEVKELIKPLRPAPAIHCQFYRHLHGGGKILAAHDGMPPESDFQGWHCQTFAKSIWCQYYELWKPFDKGRQWYLDRAYFHLYKTNLAERKLEQFLCIHSDPNCTDPPPTNTFKSGPHLHILMAEEPIPRCHFPLNLGHLKSVLSSRLNLTSAFRDAIGVICEDVLIRF